MATKQGKAALAFVKDYLTKKKGASFAEVRDAGKAAGHRIFPIVYGRTQLLLGHVKAGKQKSAKRTVEKATAAKRRVGRPAKKATIAAAPKRRGPGRPPKVKTTGLSGLDGLVRHVRGLERERDQLRGLIERIRNFLKVT